MKTLITIEQVNQAVLDRAENNRPIQSKGILFARIVEIQQAREETKQQFATWLHSRRLANLKRLDWSNS